MSVWISWKLRYSFVSFVKPVTFYTIWYILNSEPRDTKPENLLLFESFCQAKCVMWVREYKQSPELGKPSADEASANNTNFIDWKLLYRCMCLCVVRHSRVCTFFLFTFYVQSRKFSEFITCFCLNDKIRWEYGCELSSGRIRKILSQHLWSVAQRTKKNFVRKLFRFILCFFFKFYFYSSNTWTS